jgi:hypothetical protein
MTSPPDKEDPIYCEWKRCGGRGHRETQIRRIARYVVMADEVRYLVCESCSDFAVRELRQKGLLVEKHPL